MKIVKTSREFTKQEQYLMTMSPTLKMVNHVEDGETLNVSGYLTYTDTQSDGAEVEILSVIGLDKAGNVDIWACQSRTFKESFGNLASIFGDEEFTIVKISGETKAGRPYVNCDLAH